MEWGINDSLKARSYGTKSVVGDSANNLPDMDQKEGSYRDYQSNKPGKYDEWGALSQQQQELVQKEDKQIKHMESQQKRQYASVLDRQRYEKIQEKMASDQLKQREMQEKLDREKELEKAMEMEKEQRMKNNMTLSKNYKTTLEYKKEREREQKESELEEERERLKKIERDLKQEQARNQKKKATFMQEVQEVENHKRMMKEMEKQNKQSKLF